MRFDGCLYTTLLYGAIRHVIVQKFNFCLFSTLKEILATKCD